MAERIVRVWWDALHDWPLWESGSGKIAMEPSDYGLSDETVALLVLWCDARDAIDTSSYDDPRVQAPHPTAEAVERERQLARQAIAVLRREMPEDVTVVADDHRPGHPAPHGAPPRLR